MRITRTPRAVSQLGLGLPLRPSSPGRPPRAQPRLSHVGRACGSLGMPQCLQEARRLQSPESPAGRVLCPAQGEGLGEREGPQKAPTLLSLWPGPSQSLHPVTSAPLSPGPQVSAFPGGPALFLPRVPALAEEGVQLAKGVPGEANNPAHPSSQSVLWLPNVY